MYVCIYLCIVCKNVYACPIPPSRTSFLLASGVMPVGEADWEGVGSAGLLLGTLSPDRDGVVLSTERLEAPPFLSIFFQYAL